MIKTKHPTHKPSATIQPSANHRSNKNNKSLFISRGKPYTVSPSGHQNISLSDSTTTPIKFSHHTSFDTDYFKKSKYARVVRKSDKHLPSIKTVLQHVHKTALHGVNSLHLSSIIRRGVTITNKNFSRSFKLLRGIGVATQGLAILQEIGSTTLLATRHIAAHHDRTKIKSLLKSYNPETRALGTGQQAKQDLKTAKALLQKKDQLARTKKQVFFDLTLRIKQIFVTASGLVESSLLLAARFTSTVAPVLPGVSIVVSSVAFIKSAISTGTQVAALNNLASAAAATKDPLLAALSGHIKQERSIKARQHLINTSINALSSAANIGTAFTPAALSGIIASGALAIGSAIGTEAYNTYHNRKLKKQRNRPAPLPQNLSTLLPLAHKNIGIAETLFLHRIRNEDGETLKESVAFLRNLGVTESTIQRLQLAPKAAATKLLQETIYKNKLVFKGLQLKQTGYTFLHITGISAFGKKIKAGSRWLANKIKTQSTLRSAGYSLTEAPSKSLRYIATSKSKQPSLTDYIKNTYKGYSLLH